MLQELLCLLGRHPEGAYVRTYRGTTVDVRCKACGRLISRIKERGQEVKRRGKDGVTYGDLRTIDEKKEGRHVFM